MPRSVLALCFLVVTINLFDRQIVNILAQDIKHDLRLTDAELGLITGTAFGLFKAAISIPIAWWADRFDRARMLAILIAVWSGATALCGLAAGFATLALARMAVGAGESGGVPVATALLRDHAPERPTFALAIMSVGNPFGTFLAFVVGGLVAQQWGWRTAFVAAGMPGLLMTFLVWRVKDVRGERAAPGAHSACASGVIALLRTSGFPPLMGATFASMFLVAAGNAWVPPLLMRVHGLSTGEMGLYGALAIGIGGGLGSLSGTLCDFVRARAPHAESALLLTSMALAVPALGFILYCRTTAGAVIAFLIYNMVAYAWLAPTVRLIQDCANADDRALAVAVCSAFAVLLALGIGLPLTGWISDILQPSFGARSIGVSLLATASLAVAVGLACHASLLVRSSRLQRGQRLLA